MPVLSTLGAAIANVYGFTSGLIKDQYFNLVSLLLPGNGTDGKQNRTFLDSSGQNGGAGWTITPNGNATQGTFSPFSQTGWGAYFDGSNDSCSLASSSDFAIATSTTPFTLEAWVYPLSDNSTFIFAEKFNANVIAFVAGLCDGTSAWSNGRYPQFGYYSGGWTIAASSTTQAALNTWSHVAFVFTGSTSKIYLNGVDVTKSSSPTPATTWGITGNSGDAWLIGVNWEDTGNYANAYMSNLRFVNGTAVYTSAFTPSTAPLTAITNTKLLTFQSNRFVDNSSSPKTITPKNGVAITPFSPFAPTQSYSAAAVGGSGYFDGTLDSLTGPTSNSAFAFGTGAYSVEAWVYLTGFDNGGVNAAFVVDCGGATNAFNMIVNTNGSLALNKYGVGAVITGNSGKIALNSWNHIAICRNSTASNDTRLFVNGALDTTGTDSNDWTVNTTPTFGGAGNLTTLDVIGYLSGIRIIKSQALATSAFTPPTAPVSASTVGWNGSSTAISGTCSLLLNFTNAGITDATAKNVLETVGTAQISNTQSKFGGTSIYINGSGNRAVVPNVPNAALLDFGSGDVTIECWVYPTTTSTTRAILTASNSAGTTGYYFYINSSNFVDFEIPSQSIVANNNAVSANTWTHIAFTRASGTNRLFVNGNLCTTSNNNLTNVITSSGNPLRIGDSAVSGYEFPFTGYIDDLRITKGYARYTAAFTPPTAPFPVQ